MENKSKEFKNANREHSSCVVTDRNIKELILVYRKYKVKHDRLLRENSVLGEEIAELKNFKQKWERCEKNCKFLLNSIKNGKKQVVIQCDCASDKIGTLQKRVSMLEKEKRDLELSKNDDIEREKITVLDWIGKFNDADEKFLKYRKLWEEQLEEIKNLEGKIMKTKGLLVDSNQRYVQIQREKTAEFKKYKQNLLEKNSEIDEKNFKINELEGKIKFLNDKNDNNLDLINRLYEEVRNLKGKTSLANIEAQFRKKVSESESKIIELKSKLTEVNEEFKWCKISSDQQCNEINSLKLAEQNSLKEILKLKQDLLEVNKKLSESNQRYLQCSALSDKRSTEVESMKKTIKDLNLDKHCHLNEITQLKSALVEMKQKCAQYKAFADTKDTEVNQLQEQLNIKDTEVNQLQEQINMMQLKETQSSGRVAKKRPLEQSDGLAVTWATKKVKSLQSNEADNNEIVTPVGDFVSVTTNLVGHEEDSCDSNLSCDIISLLNSDDYRRLTFSKDLVMPINDCVSTQTDNSIAENASGRTYSVVRDASTHTENFIVTDASLQTEKTTAKNNSVQTDSSLAKNASVQTDNVIVKNGSAQTQDSSITDASARTENCADKNNSVRIEGSDIINSLVQTGNLCDFVPVMHSTTQGLPSNEIALKQHVTPAMSAFTTKLKSGKKTSRYSPMYKKQEFKPFKSACISSTKPAMSAKILFSDVQGEKLPETPRNLTYPNKKTNLDKTTHLNFGKSSFGMCLRNGKDFSSLGNETLQKYVKERNPKDNVKESIHKENVKNSIPKENVKRIPKDNVKESAPKNNEEETHADSDALSNNRKESFGMRVRSCKEGSKLENKTNKINVKESTSKDNEKEGIPKDNEKESILKDNVNESAPKDNVKESIPKDNVKENDSKDNEKNHAYSDTLSNNRKTNFGMFLRSCKGESKLDNKTAKDNVKENSPKENKKESIPKVNVKESVPKDNVKESIPKDNLKESDSKDNEESHADSDALSNNRKESFGMCLRNRKDESKLENKTNKINVKKSIPKDNEKEGTPKDNVKEGTPKDNVKESAPKDNGKESAPKDNVKGSIPKGNVKESDPKNDEKESHVDSHILSNRKESFGMFLKSCKDTSKLDNKTAKDNVKKSILEGSIKKCVSKEYVECVPEEYVNENCAESDTLTVKTHKKIRKSKRLKRLNNVNPEDKKFKQLYTMQPRVDVSNLGLKPQAFKICFSNDEHCSKNQKSSEECYDCSEVLKCPLPTITKSEITDVICASETGNIQTHDSDMFSEDECLVIVSDDEMLSNFTNVTEKDLNKECTDIFNNTEKLSSEAKYVTEINKNILVGIKSSGIEIKSQDEIPSVVSSEVQNDIVTTALHTDDNRISETSAVSEIPVMKSDGMAVAVENFDIQRETFKVVTDNVTKNTKDTVGSPFTNGNIMISETAEVISKKFNMKTVVDGQAVLPFSSQIRKNRARTAISFISAEEIVKTKSEDEISSVISMDTKDNAMVADNRCSDAVSDAAGKNVLSAVPENYTIPNMKPKRIAHVPKAPDSLLSDSLYFPCKSFSGLPESSKGNRTVKKCSKLKTMKKRLSKTCSTLWRNSSEKGPKIINDLVLQKTKADICNDTNVLSQHSNMSKSVTVKKSSNHKSLDKKAEPDERNVSESNDSQLLPTKQLPCSLETTTQTCVVGLFEDLSDEHEYVKTEPHDQSVKTSEPHKSKITMNPKEKPQQFSFHQSSLVYKTIRKYDRKAMKGKSKVSQQEDAKETCEALNFLLDRKELTVSKVTDQKYVNYSVPSTINSLTKQELESTLTSVSHVSDIQNDNIINASVNNKFQTKESATISEVPATHDKSQTIVKSQTSDHVSVLLKNSQSYFLTSQLESKNKFKIHGEKKSVISTAQDFSSHNVLNSDGEPPTTSSDVNHEKFEKLSTSFVLPRGSENVAKDFNKQVPMNFSFYTSSANRGDYAVDMGTNQEVSGKYVFNKNISREVSEPYDIEMNTSQKVSFEKHEVQTNKEFSSVSETPIKHLKITSASSSLKAQEVKQVRQLSSNEIVQRNRDVFMKLIRKSKKFGNYSSHMRLLGKDDTLPKVLIIMDLFNEICEPNVNYYSLHLRLRDIDPNILFACTISRLEESCDERTLNALLTFYLKWRKNDIPYLLDHIHEKLMRLKRPPLTLLVVKNLCSFYVRLSACTKDYSRLEVLIFDALYCMQHAAGVVIGEFLNACSDYLPHASKVNDDPWVLVLVHSILSVKLNFVNKNPLVNVEEIKEKLESVYGYQRGEHNFTEIVKILFSRLRANKLRKLESSFLIHCKRVSWFQSYSFVINREMFPIIDAWIKGDHVLSDEAMAVLIRLLGYLARAIDVRNGKEQIHAITRKLQRMCNVENMPQIIAKALFTTLVSHGRQDFEGVLDCVLNWKWELDNLDAVRSFLAYKKLPYWYQKFRTCKASED